MRKKDLLWAILSFFLSALGVDFLAKYCIFSQEKLAKHKRAFEAADTDEDGYLNHWQVLMALKEVAPSEALTYRILEIVDYYVTDGLTDLRLFAVMASLAQKITALEAIRSPLLQGQEDLTLARASVPHGHG